MARKPRPWEGLIARPTGTPRGMAETETGTRAPATGDGGPSRDPQSPPALTVRSWLGVLRRSVREFSDDNLTDWAAALTYYGILALFPAIIALVSILGLVGPSATDPLLKTLGTLAPGPANTIVSGAIKQVASSRGGASIALIAGILIALWSASGYVGAFARASNAIYEVEEGRPIWKLRPMQLVVTTLMILLLAACAIAVVVTGPVAQQAGNLVGAGSTAVTLFDIVKWPIIALVVVVMISILYFATPNVKLPGFRWLTPGGALAVVIWLIASGLFAVYVASFSSYNKTYGTLGGVVAFLVWLWITNLAILLGQEFNSELERGRELERGMPAEDDLQLEPRDTRKLDD
jgi:membrane protein